MSFKPDLNQKIQNNIVSFKWNGII
jgi:hypothetical protein